MSTAVPDDHRESELRRLLELATLVHFRVSALVASVAGAGPGAAGKRAILQNLARNGPMSVPQLAALRPVSRQYIQTLVDELKSNGLVELLPNPAHKRSRLVQVTESGRSELNRLEAAELPLLSGGVAGLDASQADLAAASRLLEQVLNLADARLKRAPSD